MTQARRMATTDANERLQCEWVHNGREVWKTPPRYESQPGLPQLRCLLGGTPEDSMWLATESWKGDGIMGRMETTKAIQARTHRQSVGTGAM